MCLGFVVWLLVLKRVGAAAAVSCVPLNEKSYFKRHGLRMQGPSKGQSMRVKDYGGIACSSTYSLLSRSLAALGGA